MAQASRVPVIVGTGVAGFSAASEVSGLTLARQALLTATADCGLDTSAVDGIITDMGSPFGEDYDSLCEGLGLDTRYSLQTWGHGRFTGTCLATAAAVVSAGLADAVACLNAIAWSRAPGITTEATRTGGGPYGDTPYNGMVGPVASAAMALQRYLHLYDVPREALADVVVSAHEHAALNPRALRREGLTPAAYLDSPYSVAPLRKADIFVPGDGAVCLIVAASGSTERWHSPPVAMNHLQALHAGREEITFARPGLGIHTQQPDGPASGIGRSPFDGTDLSPTDIAAFYTYDSFSTQVWFALERFGYCPPGGAPAFIAENGIGPGGRFPINTNGGMLAEAHMAGWSHLIEMVDQLRGRCGPRQLDAPEFLHWGTTYGDSMVLSLFG